jgi:hypothetical protein
MWLRREPSWSDIRQIAIQTVLAGVDADPVIAGIAD